MVGNKIIAAIRSDGKVYPLDDVGGGGGTGGSVLNSNHAHFANLVNMKLRTGGNQQSNVNESSSDIIMNNNRIQSSVMDLGKKLLQCARDNDINGVETMMRKGAPFASDWLGMTAIHFAAMNDRYDICKLLVTSGINKDARTKVDRTPLHFAAFYGHERIAQLLIEYQCTLNPRDMLRMTPLHWAVEKRHKGIVRLLIKHNADVTAISKFGKTPIALAVLTEQADILQELETARQNQLSKKYNEQHEPLPYSPILYNSIKMELSEKETNEAVNSIMSQSEDDDNEPLSKKLKTAATKIKQEVLDDTSDIKPSDNSAVNLLKSHGISMINDDEDTSNNLLSSALQNGRQLVLSEGGKLLLNEAKRMGGSKTPEAIRTAFGSQTHPILASSQSITTMAPLRSNTPTVAAKVKTEIELPTQPAKIRTTTITKVKDIAKDVAPRDLTPNNKSDKQYKNIRIISLNDFKKLYGTGNLKSLQKIETSLNKSNVTKKGDDKKLSLYRRSPERCQKSDPINPDDTDDDEESDLPPNIVKDFGESEQEDSSDVDSHHTQTTTVVNPPTPQPIESRHPLFRNQANPNNSRLSASRSPSISSTIEFKQDRTPVIPLLTVPEICRQLLELRKQNDELRRKYEIAQKEKEDFRNRMERLETLLLVEHSTEEDYTTM